SHWLLRLSQGYWLYPRSVPDDLVWAARESVPALGQCSFSTCRHPYAERRSGSCSPVIFRSHWPSSTKHGVGSSCGPDLRFRQGFANDAAVFTLCYGPQSCLPSWAGPTWSSAPAAEDVYARACPGPVTRFPSRV